MKVALYEYLQTISYVIFLPTLVLVFAGAADLSTLGQREYVGGVLIVHLSHRSILHIIKWYSQLSRRPMKAIGPVEILVAEDVIDHGRLLQKYASFYC